MKFNIVGLVAAAWTPLVASQFSCHCQIANNGVSVIAAVALCNQVGGTICYNEAGNYNVCKTNAAWTDDQCKNTFQGINEPNERFRAVCSLSSGGCAA